MSGPLTYVNNDGFHTPDRPKTLDGLGPKDIGRWGGNFTPKPQGPTPPLQFARNRQGCLWGCLGLAGVLVAALALVGFGFIVSLCIAALTA